MDGLLILVLYFEALMSMVIYIVLEVPRGTSVRVTVYMYVLWARVDN